MPRAGSVARSGFDLLLDWVSTVRGSGWVDDQHALFAIDSAVAKLTHDDLWREIISRKGAKTQQSKL